MAGLYLHIPFCAKRCIYCDFYSDTRVAYKGDYIRALLREMEIRQADWQNEPFKTIYFGGGTPSQLHPQELKKILDAIYRYFPVVTHPEITLEANPDDLSGGYIASLTTLPVNRVSIGVQSFDDRELHLLNRRHTAQEAIDAVNRCKEAGFSNIGIDLLFGLPDQSSETWIHSIDKAIELDVPHLSAYNLTYEEGTAIYQMKQKKEINSVDDDVCAQLYSILTEKLADAGFVHYEVSNFARRSVLYPDGRISLHNSSYWNGTKYLGLGPSAHSYNKTSRSWNVSDLSEYIAFFKSPIIRKRPPFRHCERSEAIQNDDIQRIVSDDCPRKDVSETEQLDERARYNDFVITRLRTMWGVSLIELRKKFGKARENYFLEKAKYLISLNKLKKVGENVKVSHKDFFISDSIIRELIV